MALRMPSRLKAVMMDGMPMAMTSPMMAITTMISIRVKPGEPVLERSGTVIWRWWS